MMIYVSLPAELANFIRDKISTGRHTSSSQVVLEALRLMEKLDQQQAEKLAWRMQVPKGSIDRAEVGDIKIAASIQEAHARFAASKRDD